MSVVLRMIILLLGASFTITVLYLLIKKRINEKSSLLWLIGSIGVLFISLQPKVLDVLAEFIGIDYPPTLLFLMAVIVLLFINLFHSVQITILSYQLKELTQYVIINTHVEEDKEE